MPEGATIADARRLGQIETGDAVLARQNSLKLGDTVKVSLQRFDPTRDSAPYYEESRGSLLQTHAGCWTRSTTSSRTMEEDLGYRWYWRASRSAAPVPCA